MNSALCRIVATALLALSLAPAAVARDWFVRAVPGATAAATGDGSRDNPFADPWLALDAAEAGDTVHVAAGVYHGRLEAGNWVVEAPNLTLLGGYDAGFARRDPWAHPTQLRFHPKYQGRNGGTLLRGGRDHGHLVIDGFLFDPADRNFYRPGDFPSLVPPAIADRVVSLSGNDITVRNCVFINASTGGITIAGEGTRFENNLLLNMAGPSMLEVRATRASKPAVIAGNTFAFAWEPRPAAVVIGAPAEVTNNVFAGCLDHALSVSVAPDQVSLANNAFMMNRAANVRYVLKGGQAGQVGDDDMGDLEDVGFKSCEGNEVIDPALPGLDKAWLDRFTQRYVFLEKTTAGKLNALRRNAGLPPAVMPPPDGTPVGGFAPPYAAASATAVVAGTAARGARRTKLDVALSPGSPPPPAHVYEPATWEALATRPEILAGKRVAIKAMFGGVQSQFPFAGIKADAYRGVRLVDPANASVGLAPLVYVKRGSPVERAVTDQGLVDNVVPRHYVVRGLVRHEPGVPGRFKGTMVVESIELYRPEVTPRRRAAAGRDLFVRAGATGGNGSKEKPFKDPFQALDAARDGDVIHVAEGEYFGKLNRGSWDIGTKDLSLLGGYTRDFASRDPWKHPTRLGYRTPPAGGGQKPSHYIVGTADHAGLVIDGFVFDGKDINTYREEGQRLDPNASPLGALIRLWASPDCVVRNCVFVNASGPAVLISGENTLVENNVIFNSYGEALHARAQLNKAPVVIRNNTILFSWTGRAGQSTSSGAGVYITGMEANLVLDRNVIGFCDGPGVFFGGDPRHIRLTGNLFANNLFAHFADGGLALLHDRSLGQLSAIGFGAARDNRSGNPAMPLDKAFMAGYVARSSAAETNISPAKWDAIRKAHGLPPAPSDDRPATTPAADDVPAPTPSVDDLLARLASVKPAAAADTTDKPQTVIFCPAYDWKKAIELIDIAGTAGAGARRVELKPVGE